MKATQKAEVYIPGKLMVAGEYSVLTPGGRALAFGVRPGLTVSLERDTHDQLTSEALGLFQEPLGNEGPTRFVYAALEACRKAVPMEGQWRIEVAGGIQIAGEKVGLGGSASVVSGVVECWREMTSNVAFSSWTQLAIRAHFTASGHRGSGYDVATTSTGGVVLYTPEVTEENRPQVTKLSWPEGLFWTAGFCGQGVSTRALLAKAKPSRRAPLSAMREGVDRLVSAWESGHVPSILRRLQELDPLLEKWSQQEGLALMTEDMKMMRSIAASEGGVSRVSGAGGGDSLLVFSDDERTVKRVEQQWAAAGYQPLSLTLSS